MAVDEDNETGDSPTLKVTDLLGIKPVANSMEKWNDAAIAGAGAFLGRICLPAAEEFGLLLKDRVSHWRAMNATSILKKTEAKVRESKLENPSAHPHIAWSILENGSWADDESLQEMWSGLLASACDKKNEASDQNIYTGLLKQLNSNQVRILNFACAEVEKFATLHGLVTAQEFDVSYEDLCAATGIDSPETFDIDIEHLRSLGLIWGYFRGGTEFHQGKIIPKLRPSTLALALYVRCQGSSKTLAEFWQLEPYAGPRSTKETGG